LHLLQRHHAFGKQNRFVALSLLPAMLLCCFICWCKQQEEAPSRLPRYIVSLMLFGGVCLTVSPLLVLGSDQSPKLKKTTAQAGTDVKAAHLNEIAARSLQEMNSFETTLKTFPHIRERSCCCFHRRNDSMANPGPNNCPV
jgi:hypothetical protein